MNRRFMACSSDVPVCYPVRQVGTVAQKSIGSCSANGDDITFINDDPAIFFAELQDETKQLDSL
jgi:hypothetical protein